MKQGEQLLVAELNLAEKHYVIGYDGYIAACYVGHGFSMAGVGLLAVANHTGSLVFLLPFSLLGPMLFDNLGFLIVQLRQFAARPSLHPQQFVKLSVNGLRIRCSARWMSSVMSRVARVATACQSKPSRLNKIHAPT
jgi:hypothetical protein